MKRLLKIFRNIILSLLALIVIVLALINMSSVQTYLAKKATNFLSEKLNTTVSIQNVRIDLLNYVSLEGLYIADQQKDTLAFLGKAEVRITDLLFMGNATPVLHYIGLANGFINLQRGKKSNEWNYAFIEKAFGGGGNKKSDGGNIELDLEKVMIDNIRFRMDDAWVGYDYDIDIGSFALNADDIDFKQKEILISNFKLVNSSIRLRDYVGSKPPSPKKISTIDTTPFNPENWIVKVDAVNLKDCHFLFIAKEEKPYPKEFDPEYIDVKAINAEWKYLKIIGDTLKAQVLHFSAKERSGFIVKEIQSEVSVSPRASILNDLFIETNNSKLSNYFAMRYNRFPDFLDFIALVKMEAKLKNATIDLRDVAYFAPQLRELPITMVKMTGDGGGTVDNLTINNADLSDGFSTVKGNLKIIGLPDIDNTFFDFQNATIVTTGTSILKYAPELKDNPNINLSALDFAIFEGSFVGSLSNFATKGVLKSNLGIVDADLKMTLPKNASIVPAYSGTVSSQAFNAGLIFRQPDLGITTLNATFEGSSFDPNNFHIKANAKIKDIVFNGYTYKDIIADGVFDKKKFDGSLLINDSNIALGFYGNVDLSEKEIKINATANLLKSDLQALNFTSIPTTLSADFDLNCSGQTIDDFIGTAKLYNINLKRKAKRMDLDSINIASYFFEGKKELDIESNLLSAKVNGNYLLSEIPNSALFYLSNYLPNYIKSNKRIAADQDVNFNIKTRKVNDLIMAFSDVLSGFDNSSFVGNLNSQKQSLSLVSAIPYGKVGDLKFYNSSIEGKGDYSKLNVKTSIDKLIVGNNMFNTSLSLDATVAQDEINYTLISKSDEQYGTATVSGNVIAREDSLFMTIAPSELYLNNSKWVIPSGNSIVYANKFLNIQNLNLNTGNQSLAIQSDLTKNGNPLMVTASNIDFAELASLTNFAAYQPVGKINGTIALSNIFDDLDITSKLQINAVKLGKDTIGTVRLFGSYLQSNQYLKLDNETGIFNDRFSLNAVGGMSFDPNNKEKIDGKIKISNLPVTLLSPLLKGYASQLSGTIDGELSFDGTVNDPSVDGEIQLLNTIAKVDYTGSIYTIPKGIIKLKEQTITLNNILLYDVYKNTGTASGTIKLKNINNPLLNLSVSTDEMEVVNLKDYENELFYGHVIAKAGFSISGSLSNLRMNINATPTQKSSLFLPYNSAGDISTNTYISFKSQDTLVDKKPLKVKDKLSVKISAVLNNLIDVSLVLDPNTGDQISATGSGNLSIDVPANDDYSMFGTYNIEKGAYTFTFRQILKKTFNINSGSSIVFAGNISNTRLNVNATYATRTRLYDLLDAAEVAQIIDNQKELEDSKASQIVDIQLQMNGTLASPDLSYQIELPEKRSLGTIAYAKLNRINTSDKTNLTNQVSSLLFLGSFIPSQGISSSLAATGKNTLGETLASQMTPVLTNALNKILGDPKLQVMLQYNSYAQDGLANSTNTTDSRNQVKFGIKRNYFNDRLVLQVGSAYDWGRPTANNQSASNFNLAGDFRAQYLLTPDGGVSIVGFRASNYDLFYGKNIDRTGLGLTFRKNFDNMYEFLHSRKRVLSEENDKAKGAKQ